MGRLLAPRSLGLPGPALWPSQIGFLPVIYMIKRSRGGLSDAAIESFWRCMFVEIWLVLWPEVGAQGFPGCPRASLGAPKGVPGGRPGGRRELLGLPWDLRDPFYMDNLII